MAILKRTSNITADGGIKCLIYGHSGAGKTFLASTLQNPLIISAESGLLSLSGFDFPYIEANSIDSLRSAYEFCASPESSGFDIVLDSISEISEVVLSAEKKATKDPRQAYGATQEKTLEIVRLFRDIQGKNVVFIAKCEKAQDEHGRLLYSPMLTGSKLGQQLPYFFDLVMPLRVEQTAEGHHYRVLQTDSDGLWQAKNRANGRLDMWEKPDLSNIFNKIKGVNQ